jgi:murein DD-endopeptidase MepM/ murein hydrolase activator NlpD
MKTLKVTLWTLGGLVLAIALFLIATIRVVEPHPATQRGPAEHPAAVPDARLTAPTFAGRLVVPVQGVERSALRSDWGDARAGGTRTHQGLDIMAPGGTPVIAAADGTVEKLYFSQGGGGITLYERSRDGKWMFYYAHLGGYAPGLTEGRRVGAGETIGYVGDTGNAGAGNHHLHFGIAMLAPGQRWWQGTPVDPYPLLTATQGVR